MNLPFGLTLPIGLYWSVAAFCLVGYSIRTAKNYMKDTENRKSYDAMTPEQKRGTGYYPTDTIGTLIGRALVSFIPVANIWVAMFDLSPHFFRSIFEWIGKVFDQPLVPRSK